MRYFIWSFLVFFSVQLNAAFQPDTNFNKNAKGIPINPNLIPDPPLNKTRKAFVTQNKFGFDPIKTDPNWVVNTFLKDIGRGMIVLDVGAGYGALTREALNRGAMVISNDIDWKHLLHILKGLNLEKRSKLRLSTDDIRKLELEPDFLDMIVFDQVLHFFSGDEIEAILKKSFKWLKPNGKIYIVMISKDHIRLRNKIFYDTSKKWPGEDLVVTKKYFPKQAYAFPETIHVMAVETLRKHLEDIGFQIEKADYVALKQTGIEYDPDGKGAIGIIAVKPKSKRFEE